MIQFGAPILCACALSHIVWLSDFLEQLFGNPLPHYQELSFAFRVGHVLISISVVFNCASFISLTSQCIFHLESTNAFPSFIVKMIKFGHNYNIKLNMYINNVPQIYWIVLN